MAFSNIAPPKPFLDAPGRPPVPWDEWYKRFQRYMDAAGAAEFSAVRRQSILIHNLGDEGQRIYDAVIVSRLPPPATATLPPATGPAVNAAGEATTSSQSVHVASPSHDCYVKTVAALANHFSANTSAIVERYRFRRCYQQANESLAEYIAALRQLATTCDLGTRVNEDLREQLIAGISSTSLREHDTAPCARHSPLSQHSLAR